MSEDREWSRRRESFDLVADAYDRYRTAPPVPVVAALITSADLLPGSRVLEIGCGTGQLSVPLAEHGVDLVAVELGPNLAALARRNLGEFPNARVEVGAFEDWPLPEHKFDSVVCARAFSWLDPAVRYSKSAQALRTGGALAILHMNQARGGTPGFVEDAHRFYVKWGLSEDPSFQPTDAADLPLMCPELEELEEFNSVERQRFEIPMDLSTASYVGWLRTDSRVNRIDEAARRGFLDDIEQLIATRYNGSVTRSFVHDLIVARRAE